MALCTPSRHFQLASLPPNSFWSWPCTSSGPDLCAYPQSATAGVLGSVLFPFISIEVSAVSALGLGRDKSLISMCFRWQPSAASSHIQVNVWCASYSALLRGVKQWDEQAAVICLKMSPFWELQTADKSCQSAEANTEKAGKDFVQTFSRRKSRLFRQAAKTKELISQSINQFNKYLWILHHVPDSLIGNTEKTEWKNDKILAPCSLSSRTQRIDA